MVAKTFWLVIVSVVLLVSGCTTLPVADAETRRAEANQPEKTDSEPVIVLTEPDQDEVQSTDIAPSDSNSTDSEATVVKEQPSVQKAPASNQPQPSPEQVVTRLQQEALQLQSEGRWQEAELKLERALRIDAEKVDLYHQLATVRMGQSRFAEAEQIALKGLTLTDNTPKFKSSLWDVIAQCRSAQGDIQGARDAREEVLKWLDEN